MNYPINFGAKKMSHSMAMHAQKNGHNNTTLLICYTVGKGVSQNVSLWRAANHKAWIGLRRMEFNAFCRLHEMING